MSSSYPPDWQWSTGDSLESFLDSVEGLYDQSAERAAQRTAELAAKAAK